ncbi:MAG: virulence RhuM family protein [Kofleriaceae bacterium]
MSDTTPPQSELILYQTEDGEARIECRFEDNTIWLTQDQLAELFETSVPNINLHLKNVYEDRELDEEATIKSYLIVRTEGSRRVQRSVLHYSLPAILAVGYRVRSRRGTQFRQWATTRLAEYLVKGFTLDDQRLKRTDRVTDYFDELLTRIREIRASEARVYQRVREIFSLASDYRERDHEAQIFFAKMQNKMHYAATGLTAAEIVHRRADATKPNMGLTSWSGDRVLKRDVVTAKNYLDSDEIDTLNRIVVMFLDRAEFRAQRRKDIKMADWEADLDKFLADTELPVLAAAGSISHELATTWANEQYDEFAVRRREEAEARAEAKYIEDLTVAAKLLESSQKAAAPKAPKRKKKS